MASENAHHLRAYILMEDSEFNALPSRQQNEKWWTPLRMVVAPCLPPRTMQSLAKLRDEMKHRWIEKDDSSWIKQLVEHGQLVCMACTKFNSVSGKIGLVSGRMEEHMKSSGHLRNVARYDATVQRIDAMKGGAGAGAGVGAGAGAGGSLTERDVLGTKHYLQALAVSSMVAGGNGAAGVPPSAIPVYLRRSVLDVLSELDGGMPSADTIKTTTLKDAVELVKERIKLKLGLDDGVQISLYIDGGGAKWRADGRKVVVVCASSLLWDEPLLLSVEVRKMGANYYATSYATLTLLLPSPTLCRFLNAMRQPKYKLNK